MSTSRFSRLVFVFLLLALTVHGQKKNTTKSDADQSGDSSGQSGETTSTGTVSNEPMSSTVTTAGIMGAITPYLRPVTTLLYQTLDSILRNVFQKSLPCTIYDMTRLDIECTSIN